jgi:hypothetical protein
MKQNIYKTTLTILNNKHTTDEIYSTKLNVKCQLNVQ